MVDFSTNQRSNCNYRSRSGWVKWQSTLEQFNPYRHGFIGVLFVFVLSAVVAGVNVLFICRFKNVRSFSLVSPQFIDRI